MRTSSSLSASFNSPTGSLTYPPGRLRRFIASFITVMLLPLWWLARNFSRGATSFHRV